MPGWGKQTPHHVTTSFSEMTATAGEGEGEGEDMAGAGRLYQSDPLYI